MTLKPARKLTVYILPHSHTDIGYTAIQTDIEEKQINNLLQGMADARRTANYPGRAVCVERRGAVGRRLFLQRLCEQQRARVFRGREKRPGRAQRHVSERADRPVSAGGTAAAVPLRHQLGERTGVPVDSAMISDVPGYTWGTVTAMAQAGIRYFSVGA